MAAVKEQSPLERSIEQARAEIEGKIGALDEEVRERVRELYEAGLYDRDRLECYENPTPLDHLRVRVEAYSLATREKVRVFVENNQAALKYE